MTELHKQVSIITEYRHIFSETHPCTFNTIINSFYTHLWAKTIDNVTHFTFTNEPLTEVEMCAWPCKLHQWTCCTLKLSIRKFDLKVSWRRW